MKFYYLNEDHTYRPADVLEWEAQLEILDPHVASDIINGKRVSTVWLAVDHAVDGTKPFLFETMVFNSDDIEKDIYTDRYSTWDEAVEGHQKAIEWVKNNYG